MKIAFVPAKPEDSGYFYETRKASMTPHMEKIGRHWDEDYERRYNSQRFAEQLPYLRMIYVDGARVGFVSVRPKDQDSVYLESFCIERKFQNRGIAQTVFAMILQEPGLRHKKMVAEIMKAYASAQIAEKMGFHLVDDSGELDIYERPASS